MGLWEKIKTVFAVKKFVDTQVKEAKRMDTGKPGWKTTEFYLTLLTNIVAIVGSLKGVIPQEAATIVVAVANGIYGIIRAVTKANVPATIDTSKPA